MQDVIAPDVRELKARVDGLEHRMDDRFKSLEQRMDGSFKSLEQRMDGSFKSLEQRMDDRFAAVDQKIESQIGKVLFAIAEMKNNNELTAVREVSALRERVAVLEMQQKQSQQSAA